MTFGSLFAGIGGFDLGLERSGMECRWQVEIDEFCIKVLSKHWPEVRRYGNVEQLGGADLERVDAICGGFPCQDLSQAGKQVGIEGSRSRLWFEYARLVGELRPKFVLIENVAGLLVYHGMRRVIGELAGRGYVGCWRSLRASEFGASHLRKRVFVIAYRDDLEYAHGNGSQNGRAAIIEPLRTGRGLDERYAPAESGDDVAHAEHAGPSRAGTAARPSAETVHALRSSGGDVGDSDGAGPASIRPGRPAATDAAGAELADADKRQLREAHDSDRRDAFRDEPGRCDPHVADADAGRPHARWAGSGEEDGSRQSDHARRHGTHVADAGSGLWRPSERLDLAEVMDERGRDAAAEITGVRGAEDVADSECGRGRLRSITGQTDEAADRFADGGSHVADRESGGRGELWEPSGSDGLADGCDEELADAGIDGGRWWEEHAPGEWGPELCDGGEELADAAGDGYEVGTWSDRYGDELYQAGEIGRSVPRESERCGGVLADAECPEWREDDEYEQLRAERREAADRFGSDCVKVAYGDEQHGRQDIYGWSGERAEDGDGSPLGDSERARWQASRLRCDEHAGREPEAGCGALADAADRLVPQPRREAEERDGSGSAGAALSSGGERTGAAMADAAGGAGVDVPGEGGVERGPRRRIAGDERRSLEHAHGAGLEERTGRGELPFRWDAESLAPGLRDAADDASRRTLADSAEQRDRESQPAIPEHVGCIPRERWEAIRRTADALRRGANVHEGELADSDLSGFRMRGRSRQYTEWQARQLALPRFAPGPADPRWPTILRERPDLAPALANAVRKRDGGRDAGRADLGRDGTEGEVREPLGTRSGGDAGNGTAAS